MSVTPAVESGSTVVVTAAGSGIGRALAARFAREGARVVVNDRHPERAEGVAAELGGHALPGEATDDLVPAARALLGAEIDVYCANAGTISSGGPEAPDDTWAEAWDVNVMAHVRAARALLPSWLERGRGRFVSVVSSAGLLTMLGAAPYAVSKHAALSFAEWLAITYRHRGVDVHAICPRGVSTQMQRKGASELPLSSTAIPPEAVADALFGAIEAGDFLVLPHPEVADHLSVKLKDRKKWLVDLNDRQRLNEQARATARSPTRAAAGENTQEERS